MISGSPGAEPSRARGRPTTSRRNSDGKRGGGLVRKQTCTSLHAGAYHLATGHPPLARTPLPVRAQVPGLPERAAVVLDAALVPEPSERPDVGVLGDALRAARDELR